MLVHMTRLRISLHEIFNGFSDFLAMLFSVQGREGERQVPYCNSRFGLYNKCMEGQYGKVDVLSFDLYKSCQQLKAQLGNLHGIAKCSESSTGFAGRSGGEPVVKTHVRH